MTESRHPEVTSLSERLIRRRHEMADEEKRLQNRLQELERRETEIHDRSLLLDQEWKKLDLERERLGQIKRRGLWVLLPLFILVMIAALYSTFDLYRKLGTSSDLINVISKNVVSLTGTLERQQVNASAGKVELNQGLQSGIEELEKTSQLLKQLKTDLTQKPPLTSSPVLAGQEKEPDQQSLPGRSEATEMSREQNNLADLEKQLDEKNKTIVLQQNILEGKLHDIELLQKQLSDAQALLGQLSSQLNGGEPPPDTTENNRLDVK